MSPRQRQPTAERRRQIADAALHILSEEGVHRLTAMEIAKRVGIAGGTIFRHFKDKDEIIAAAVARVQEIFFEGFPPADPDPLERLGRFVTGRLELVRRHPEVVRVVMSDRLDEAAGATADSHPSRDIQDRVLTFIRGCLVEAQQKGQVGRDLSSSILAASLIGTLRASALGDVGTGHRPSPEQMWQTLETLLRRSACEC